MGNTDLLNKRKNSHNALRIRPEGLEIDWFMTWHRTMNIVRECGRLNICAQPIFENISISESAVTVNCAKSIVKKGQVL